MSINSETQQTVKKLADALIDMLEEKNADERVIIAVSGGAGSGKSFLSNAVCEEVNERLGKPVATVLPMDGFHLTKGQLAAMEDPDYAIMRRGSPWTFDGQGFANIVKQIHEKTDRVVWAPSFDHAVGDPVVNSIAIKPAHKIVLVEGLYTHVRDEPWCNVCNLVDQRWWIQPRNEEQSLERLLQRHVDAGLAKDRKAALERYNTNDKLNSDYADENRYPPHQVIHN